MVASAATHELLSGTGGAARAQATEDEDARK